MTIDNEGILHNSTVGGCRNYNPDINRPTGVKAHDVEGLLIYKCLNCTPTELGTKIKHTCGALRYCERFEAKAERTGAQR